MIEEVQQHIFWKLASLGVVAAAVSVTSPAAAAPLPGPGEWDHVGTSRFHDSGEDTTRYHSGIGRSAGGDFRACVYTASSTFTAYYLWEDDPDGNADEPVEGRSSDDLPCLVFRDIGRYVDGSNNRAEFYIRTPDHNAMRVEWYD
ncbi:hypothetical protein E1265_26545 [Streptomyces sp. 8K308]|uniref:hypothetical protein n=1 Tax=Streptomyces sp. 8K308 TaxID=2530388 RepID=UPI001048A91D|nr:hypothetical protein [Streptomyces sp. 8K308]TDC15536.1 hypothetical protein E1265_26545 [Streptomyces sp. 8K308]